jgi:high-affinity nickel-transport protein
LISSSFLYLVAALNAVALVGLVRSRREGRTDDEVGEILIRRGLMSRLGLQRFVRSGWQMYPVGVLFGLSFDTASEIALLGLTAIAEAHQRVPALAILALPILFAAGMTLLDTSDGVFMAYAYGEALRRPSSRFRYNFMTTALSVVAAGAVATFQLAGALETRLQAHGVVADLIAMANGRVELWGALVVALFVILWATSTVGGATSGATRNTDSVVGVTTSGSSA